MAEVRHSYGCASPVPMKGCDSYAVAFGASFLQELGYGKLVLLSDPEPAMNRLFWT